MVHTEKSVTVLCYLQVIYLIESIKYPICVYLM